MRINQNNRQTGYTISRRIGYFDLLRIIAALMVVLVHVSSQNWKEVDHTSGEFVIRTIYDGFGRWAVPIFVMISGALFLDKDYHIKKIYRHSICPLIVAFVFWSFIYAVIPISTTRETKSVLESFISGEYHMWFIFMIIGLYMVVPILKLLIKHDDLTRYFLVLAFIFVGIVPWIITATDMKFNSVAYFLQEDVQYLNLHMVLGYTFYFLLGYVLHNKQLSKKICLLIYIIGIGGLLFTIFGTLVLSRLTNKPNDYLFDYLSPNVMMLSIAVFCFAKHHLKSERISNSVFVRKMSKATFGIYLIHALVIAILSKCFNFDTTTFSPIISIPVITILVFVISSIISWLLNLIPGVKKYLV